MTPSLCAEWTKLRTLPGTGWLAAGAIALTIATSAIIAAATHLSAGGGAQDPTKMALLGIELDKPSSQCSPCLPCPRNTAPA
jgi:ABC-2 type transport system permease protein